MERNDPEQATQEEIRQDAANEGDDRHTSREEVELDLMESDASDAGHHLGHPTP